MNQKCEQCGDHLHAKDYCFYCEAGVKCYEHKPTQPEGVTICAVCEKENRIAANAQALADFQMAASGRLFL